MSRKRHPGWVVHVREFMKKMGLFPSGKALIAVSAGPDSMALAELFYELHKMGDLPQIELLAYYLDVPVSHFWSLKTIDASMVPSKVPVPVVGT